MPEYDPRLAGQAIEALGYPAGTDAFLRDVSGQRLTVELRTTGGDTLRERIHLAAMRPVQLVDRPRGDGRLREAANARRRLCIA